jgi:hypothetical protein
VFVVYVSAFKADCLFSAAAAAQNSFFSMLNTLLTFHLTIIIIFCKYNLKNPFFLLQEICVLLQRIFRKS